MNIAIFGGSFDPIHKGHLALAKSALKLAGLKKIIFVPTSNPPHKTKIFASGKDRLAMIRLSIRNNSCFSISDYELKKKGVSYSYQTIEYIKRKYPKDRVCFLMSDDSLSAITTWEKGWNLLDLCPFLVGRRKGIKNIKIPSENRSKITFLSTPLINVSSSLVRDRIKHDKKINSFVPKSVSKYIQKRKIYK
ncbi:MAG: nicotinate-nucleotide adenylyltransferase [bacterium]